MQRLLGCRDFTYAFWTVCRISWAFVQLFCLKEFLLGHQLGMLGSYINLLRLLLLSKKSCLESINAEGMGYIKRTRFNQAINFIAMTITWCTWRISFKAELESCWGNFQKNECSHILNSNILCETNDKYKYISCLFHHITIFICI